MVSRRAGGHASHFNVQIPGGPFLIKKVLDNDTGAVLACLVHLTVKTVVLVQSSAAPVLMFPNQYGCWVNSAS